MKRITNGTMKRSIKRSSFVVGIATALALMPGAAFAVNQAYEAAQLPVAMASTSVSAEEGASDATSRLLALAQDYQAAQSEARASYAQLEDFAAGASGKGAADETVEKVLPYDPALIEAIGTQEQTGHTICCPSFSCAYADAVMDATLHDHDYYTCSCCTWTDWGGGDSSDRCVGTDEELLREAYDQLSAGRPTVIHVSAGYGEHWIALIGYTGATDPDHLTLSNFIALDPWDGAQINAGDRFDLYGDGCEHISDRSTAAA